MAHQCSLCEHFFAHMKCGVKQSIHGLNGWDIFSLMGRVQRREDMTSRRSNNLDALITFQGQGSRMQVTRMALWTK